MRFLEDATKQELIDIVMEHRYDGHIDDKMPRCPYDIGDEQKQCPKFEMMEDFEEGKPFYCTHCLIDNSKGWCEQGIKRNATERAMEIYGLKDQTREGK
jgi:hypothetical protein